MIELTPEIRAEQLRREILKFLAPRQAVSFEPQVILERIAANHVLDFKPHPDEFAAALTFLRGRGWVEIKRSPFGRTLFYQATSAGVLAHERGELEDPQP